MFLHIQQGNDTQVMYTGKNRTTEQAIDYIRTYQFNRAYHNRSDKAVNLLLSRNIARA